MPRYLDTTTSNRELAENLARDGFRVFPCHSTGPSAKRPLTPHGFKDATDDPAQVRKWWAKWPDAAPGLPTGEANGVSVIDLDLKGAKEGIAAARARGIDPDAAEFVVRTPSGGLHLIFEHAAGVRNETGADGFDVRGEGGYIIAPGARIEGGAYVVERGGDLDTARILGLPAFPAAAIRPPAEPLDGPQAPPGGADVGELRAALACIPNDGSYDEWLHILAGLHHATGGSEHGLALALGWSAGYDGFDPKEVRTKWRSFGRDRDTLVTAATVFAEARRHGWQGITDSDFEDLPEDDGGPSVEDLLDMTPEPSEVAGLPFLTPGECAALPARDYAVKRFIAPGQIGCIFGEPGAGKSLIAPRLAYAVAQGEEWFGLRTRKAPVFYVACEDQDGMAQRVAALHQDLGAAPGFHLFQTVTDLFSPGQIEGKGSPQFEALRRAVKAKRPGLIVIDTLAAGMPGLEENDAAAMNRVVQIGRALARHGAAVIFVHHGTKADGTTPRGHSVFNGALDFSLMVKPADQGGIVRGQIKKNRNGPADLDIAFRIGTRHVGTDIDSDPVYAPICEPCDPEAGSTSPRLTRTERAALDHLATMMGDGNSVEESAWRKAAVDGLHVSGSDDRDNRRRAVSRAIQGLVEKSHVHLRDGRLWLSTIDGEFDDLGRESDDD